jgi:hypothetical protein
MDKRLIGRRIVEVRPLTEKEFAREGWDLDVNCRPPALVLDDGQVLFPARDPEGNGPGALFGQEGDLCFMVLAR